MKTKIIVTSGPTREHFDPIRFLSNPSTGRMGHSIATAAVATGAFEVVYIAGPVPVEFAKVTGAQNFAVTSTDEMQAAVGDHLVILDRALYFHRGHRNGQSRGEGGAAGPLTVPAMTVEHGERRRRALVAQRATSAASREGQVQRFPPGRSIAAPPELRRPLPRSCSVNRSALPLLRQWARHRGSRPHPKVHGTGRDEGFDPFAEQHTSIVSRSERDARWKFVGLL